MLRNILQIQLKKIEFAEAISNSYVDKEKAYQVMCKVYKNKSMWESGKDRFSEQEVLALILHLNTGDDITLCETAANELFKSIRLDRKGIINFVFVNMCASAQRITKEFSLVSIEDYLKVKNLVSGGIADHSNVIAHIIVTAKARNESIEVIYQEVKAELEE